MKKARFGENFHPDETNRMEVLRNQEKLPEYVAFARKIRENLKESIQEDGWPELPPDVESAENFFDSAKNAVTERWQDVALPQIAQETKEWVTRLPENERELRMILENPAKLEEKMKIRQFGILEPMRERLPEAWKSLVLASSERQLAEIVLLRRWLKDLPDTACEKMGFNKAELELFIDAVSLFGKYVDQAYLKQMELADLPGGQEKTKFTGEQGAERLYDIYTSEGDDISLKTYSEVFSFEWPRLVQRIKMLAEKTERLLEAEAIPETYREFPAYLHDMADAYGSQETSLQPLREKWDQLAASSVELAQRGCPIMIVPQEEPSVAGSANKVDVEIRVGLRTPALIEKEKELKSMKSITERIRDNYSHAITRVKPIPDVTLSYQPFAFGPNLFWMTRAQAKETYIVAHPNAIEDVSQATEIPLLEKAFSIDVKEQEYLSAALRETAFHECAHTVLNRGDPAVNKRIGTEPEAALVEELKAETVLMNVLKTYLEETNASEEDTRIQFLAKLGTICDYLANKSSERGTSGERYFYPGVVMIEALLASGAIRKDKESYAVVDARAGMDAIIAAGDEVLRMYASDETTPETIREFGESIRKKKEEKDIAEFIELLKKK